MAIALDTTASDRDQSGLSSTITESMTLASGASLVVGVYLGSSRTLTGATWNSVSLTTLQTVTIGTNTIRGYLLFLQSADSGTHNLVITASGTPDPYLMVAASFTGVTGNRSSGFQASGSGTAISTTVTDAVSGDTVISMSFGLTGPVSTSNTEIIEQPAFSSAFMALGSAAASGSFQFDWTQGDTVEWGTAAFALNGEAPPGFAINLNNLRPNAFAPGVAR